MATEMFHFSDRLFSQVLAKRSRVVVGLDSDIFRIPACFHIAGGGPSGFAQAQLEFNRVIIESIKDIAVAVKLQVAYYEALGSMGIEVYDKTARLAREAGLIVIGDIKRGDIGSTARAYARAHLGREGSVDAVTVNPFLGSDGVLPFVELAAEMGRGVFVLVRTSNESASEIQDLEVRHKSGRSTQVYKEVARLVGEWGHGLVGELGYSMVGAVVGATAPEEGAELRGLLQRTPFLVPGYGTQGGSAAAIGGYFDELGLGAVVNSSRGIIFAFEGRGARPSVEEVVKSVVEAASDMRDDLNAALAEPAG